MQSSVYITFKNDQFPLQDACTGNRSSCICVQRCGVWWIQLPLLPACNTYCKFLHWLLHHGWLKGRGDLIYSWLIPIVTVCSLSFSVSLSVHLTEWLSVYNFDVVLEIGRLGPTSTANTKRKFTCGMFIFPNLHYKPQAAQLWCLETVTENLN